MAQHTEEKAQSQVTGEGNNLGFSIAVFSVTFILFCAGLYVMSLYPAGPIWFSVGLGMCIVALFIAFDIVPRFFTK